MTVLGFRIPCSTDTAEILVAVWSSLADGVLSSSELNALVNIYEASFIMGWDATSSFLYDRVW